MDRAERIGLGTAFVGHAAIVAVILLGLVAPKPLPRIENEPIEVELVEEVAKVSRAPQAAPAPAPPAPTDPAPGFDTPTFEPVPAPPAPPEPPKAVELPPPPPPPKPKPLPPKPAPRPVPKPVPLPKPAPKPSPPKPSPPKPAPPKPAPAKPVPSKPTPAKPAKPTTKPGSNTATRPGPDVRPTGALNNLMNGSGSKPATNPTPGAKPNPAPAGKPTIDKAAIERAISAEVRRQIKPHWKAPSGADAEQIVTVLKILISRDGSLTAEPSVLRQSGVTESNNPQAPLHRANAVRAVRAAAPFKLPQEYFDIWKDGFNVTFDKRLSQ